MTLYISPPPRNPLTAILAVLAGALVMVGAFFLGFIALVIAAGLGLVVWIVILVRVKWIQWQLKKKGIDPFADLAGSQSRSEQVHSEIEAEYTVVSTESED